MTSLRPNTSERPAGPGVIAAFAAIYLFWGGTFLAIRYAVAEVPPLLTIAIRCLGGAVLLYAWLVWRAFMIGRSLSMASRMRRSAIMRNLSSCSLTESMPAASPGFGRPGASLLHYTSKRPSLPART